MRRENLGPDEALARLRTQLRDLENKLDFVQPMADEIDRRTAEFTRRSLARSRYLQEFVGERRGQMKEFFERLNSAFAGRRLVDLDDLPGLPPPLLPEYRIPAGRDSLYEPPRRRTLEENAPVDDEAGETLRDQTKAQLGGAITHSLTVVRANRLAARLPGGKGDRVSSADLPIESAEDIADVIALLLHAQSAEARYRIEPAQEAEDPQPPDRDRKLIYMLDRFFVIKK